jgi:hypothetical protein
MPSVKAADCLVKMDTFCDYVPILSTVSNLVDIVQKCFTLPAMKRKELYEDHYFTHLQQKNIPRCIILLIPILGNIVIAICDRMSRKYNDRDFVLKEVQKDGLFLKKASTELKSDEEVVLKAINQEGKAILYADAMLAANFNFTANSQVRNALKHANRNFALTAFLCDRNLFDFINDKFRQDKAFVLEAVRKNCHVYKSCISEDDDIILAAVTQNETLMEYVSSDKRKDKFLMLAVLKKNGLALNYLSDEFKDDDNLVYAAVKQNKKAIELASPRLKKIYWDKQPHI